MAVSQGTAIYQSDFIDQRSYVRYHIAGTGRRYWYGSIAERFHVVGGWKKIAENTLKINTNAIAAGELEESQYVLEVGQEVRIPIRDDPSAK